MIKLAVVSPSTKEHPETFIQSHIDGIRADVTYYYGDLVPRYVKGEGLFSMDSRHVGDRRAWLRLLAHFCPVSYKRSRLGLKEYLFARSLRKHHIDVVLAEYGTTGAHIFEACRYAGIPLVVHFHGRDCTAYDNIRQYGEPYKRMFAYASRVVAVSHDMERRLMALSCPKDKLVYAPCCPDPLFAGLTPTLGKLQYCFVGRFTDKKAPYALLLAFQKVVERHPDARLVMVGDGPLHNTCVNLARLMNLGDQVVFTGQATPEEIRSIMVESLAYVQHSVRAADGDMEGTPVSVMEASAMGLPVVATRHAGITDVVVDGQTGLLCDELDVPKMAGDMLRLASDTDLARQLGANGKRRMKEHFSKQWQMDVLTDTVERACRMA
jgi:colanic acid/amylovoran biosynthesis glycosyltransferase